MDHPKEELKPRLINPVFTDADLSENNSLIKLSVFFLQDFFDWWFVRMPIIYLRRIQRVSTILNDQLSISLLVSTFFTPWKKDRKPIGYFMGVSLRVIYLPVAISIYVVTMTVYTLAVVLWVFLPLFTIAFLIISPFLV